MATEIIVMATMAAALLLVAGFWADLYTFAAPRKAPVAVRRRK